MREISVFKAIASMARRPAGLSSVDDSRGWMHLFGWGGGDGDLNTGDWQKDLQPPVDISLAHFAAYRCVTQPAADIAKLCLRLMAREQSGIWSETENSAFSPVLREPNHFQTMQQFVESWLISKLSRGNTYVLLERDESNKVRKEYVLDPNRVTPLVAPDGSVYYELQSDDLSHLPVDIIAAPASEIIHDRMNCLFHPLVGVSPLYACGLASKQGIEMQKNSAEFFKNMSRPSGVLSAPKEIKEETAKRIKTQWEENFGKGKIGRVAVLGDDLKYYPMAVTPVDAAIVDQLKLSAEVVCAAYGVPRFMVGIGDMPSVDNVQALWQLYYTQCLQSLIEAFERLQDKALGLPHRELRTEFDLDDLLRMDTKTQAEVEGILVQRGIGAPNESRRKFNKPPVAGGNVPYLQQQNYSLEALAKRDASEDPFGKASAAPAPPPAPSADEAKAIAQQAAEAAATMVREQAEAQRADELRLAREAHEREIAAAEARATADRARADEQARRMAELEAEVRERRSAEEQQRQADAFAAALDRELDRAAA